MTDGPQEYEVESVTRARVHDKKGKKITWRYYVKWKGYDWDESTWEPTDSFQGGSEHILESFWQRIDTGGRDVSDATAFKKGEELLVSGPPGRRGLKRKASSGKTRVALASPSSNDVTISAPLLTPRKRRRVQIPADDERGQSKRKRRVSAGSPKNGEISSRPPRRRRFSSPGPRKSGQKRQPSAGDSQLDADGETDPDVVEVEDELMQVSVEDAEEDAAKTQHLPTASGSANGTQKISFDDLEHFYTGNPIDIDQNTDEQVATRKSESRPVPHLAIGGEHDAIAEASASPSLSSPDPLFDSPLPSPSKGPEIQKDTVPHHRARAANPLIKLIDTTTVGTTSKQSRISAKARLISIQDAPSAGAVSRNVAKRGGKPGPGRSSSGLITRNRSSLLTATKGSLKSVKGNFTRSIAEHDQPDEIEEVPTIGGASEGNKLHVSSWSDEDIVVQDDRTASKSRSVPPPSGDELLKLAGLQADPEALPDYEDDSQEQPQKVVETQESILTPAPAEESINESLVKVAGDNADDHVADSSPSTSEAVQQASGSVIGGPSVLSVVTPAVDEVKKNIELAKEHLFPTVQTSFNTFGTGQSSFRSTIFGPLYQGFSANHVPEAENEFSTTFKVILGDGVELPLVLKDCSKLKARISDILIGHSSGSKVALFYSAEDADAMVNTLKSDGTARVVLDPSAMPMQQERFSALMQRFEASQTLIAPVGKEVCVMYSSKNGAVGEKLGVPGQLRGLSGTLLITHASIENQLAYVAAIMKATAL